MKKILSTVLAFGIILGLSACGASSSQSTEGSASVSPSANSTGATDTSENENSELNYHGVVLNIPAGWRSKAGDENTQYYYPDNADSMVMIGYSEIDLTEDTIQEQLDDFADGIAEVEGVRDLRKTEYTIDNIDGMKVTYTQNIDGQDRSLTVYTVPVNMDGFFSILFCEGKDPDRNYSEEYKNVLDSVTLPISDETTSGPVDSDEKFFMEEVIDNAPDEIRDHIVSRTCADMKKLDLGEEISVSVEIDDLANMGAVAAFLLEATKENIDSDRESEVRIDYFEGDKAASWSCKDLTKGLLIDTINDITEDDVTPEGLTELYNSGDAIKDTEDSEETVESEETEETVEEDEPLSVERSSALEKAESYLSFTAFSHDGLVKQLEYEKFSHEDAVYAADHCGADWNEQAAKKAKSYREMTSFSHAALVDQLKYDGFTAEQAEYGVSQTE